MNLSNKQLWALLTPEQKQELSEKAFKKMQEAIETLPLKQVQNGFIKEIRYAIEELPLVDLSDSMREVENAMHVAVSQQLKNMVKKLNQ